MSDASFSAASNGLPSRHCEFDSRRTLHLRAKVDKVSVVQSCSHPTPTLSVEKRMPTVTFSNNIAVGLRAAEALVYGSGSIFLGAGAGRELIEANNLLCVVVDGKELRFDMTERESSALRCFVRTRAEDNLSGNNLDLDALVAEVLRLRSDLGLAHSLAVDTPSKISPDCDDGLGLDR